MSNTELVKKRGIVKGKLTSFVKYVTSFDKSDYEQLQLRLERVEETWEAYQDVQGSLEQGEKDEALLEAHQHDREQFEDFYYKHVAMARKLLKEEAANMEHIARNSQAASASNENVPSPVYKPNIKLPPLNLKTFSGNYEEWHEFSDTFTGAIDRYPGLPPSHKLYYLRSCLTGKAAEIIKSIESTDENYETAWKLLKENYESKRLIVQRHVKLLYELPALTKESATELHALYNNAQGHIRALTSLGQATDSWGALLLHLMTSKLDRDTLKAWERKIKGMQVPTLESFWTFLKEHYQMLESLSINTSDTLRSTPKSSVPMKPQSVYVTTDQFKISCAACNEEHNIKNCGKFLSMPYEEKIELIKSAKMCFNCLRLGHGVSTCRASRCKRCDRKHHTSIHKENVIMSAVEESEEPATNSPKASLQAIITSQVLLSTALVNIIDKHGNKRTCRVLLDNGSQSNFIRADFARMLNLEQKELKVPVAGFGDNLTYMKHATEAVIQSKCSGYTAKLTFLIAPKITEKLPTQQIDTSTLNLPKNVRLADPSFHRPAPVDALIGAEIFYQLLCVGQISLDQSALIQKTQLGWIVAGNAKGTNEQKASFCYLTTRTLEDQVKKFWELEEMPSPKHLSIEEGWCEDHFLKNVERLDNGRYQVCLPFNSKRLTLGNSYDLAEKRFFKLEKRLQGDPELRSNYSSFLNEYEMLGHMRHLEKTEDKTAYYIPHHAVIKEDSLTTKLRVVFDASMKTDSGISLNDTLMVGAIIQPDIFTVLLRFRSHLIALVADVEKMYRQILVHHKDTPYQRIIWRKHPGDPIAIYELLTLTYGTTSASHLAIRSLFKLAEDDGAQFPNASRVIREEMYVDDVMSGAKNVEKALQLQEKLTALLAKGGFNLRKWISNEPKILEKIIKTQEECLCLDPNSKTKTLGISWIPRTDSLLYVIKNTGFTKVTKRTILSELAALFDPLGLIGPVIVFAKIVLQRLWKIQQGWDESVPESISTDWVRFKRELPELENFHVERCLFIADHVSVQLHGFADASESAYGVCFYVRSESAAGDFTCKLICAKSRVAPLKKQSIPRLELCAALLLSKVLQNIIAALKLEFDSIHLWLDSTIALQWIRSSPHTLETFIANRVAKIQESTEVNWWHHVKGVENPADLISRGCMPKELLMRLDWLSGPGWLKLNEDLWPRAVCEDLTPTLGLRKQINLVCTSESQGILCKFSSICKLKRVVAYVLKFIFNVRERIVSVRARPDEKGANYLISKRIKNCNEAARVYLTVPDLARAMNCILKLVQCEAFGDDIAKLKGGKHLPRASKLLQLSPFLDDEGLLRVGGRIKHASLGYDQKHQILLPQNHPVTNMIIEYAHSTCLHGGAQSTLNAVRQRYWPINGKTIVKKIIHSCVTCARHAAAAPNYIMADLPECRVVSTRPFVNVGLDFCGPFFVKEKRHRNRGKEKVYICVFVCMACKAVHFEVVGDLTSESFIATLKRFCARRGKPRTIYSDNATNFTAADRELKEVFNSLRLNQTNSAVYNFVTNEGIEWKFIPPRAPHFGGMWESAVRSFKGHFRRVIGETLLSYEQFNSIVIEIEGVLNSRPITAISSDAHDILSLSPSHFLIGDSVKTIPENDLTELADNRLSAWQLVQKLKQSFWRRWHKEYLNQLTQRTKWFSGKVDEIKIGQVVILREDNVPCSLWPLAKIVEIHPAPDGVVRVVTVKTSSGVFKRCVKRIVILPIENKF